MLKIWAGLIDNQNIDQGMSIQKGKIIPYSWVNESWAFLAENYVILEYFLTRNM